MLEVKAIIIKCFNQHKTVKNGYKIVLIKKHYFNFFYFWLNVRFSVKSVVQTQVLNWSVSLSKL